MDAETAQTTIRDAALDRLPESLYFAVAAGPVSSLDERIDGVMGLRSALLEGRVPKPQTLPWPSSPVRERIVSWLQESGLSRYCRDAPDLTDAVMLSIIEQASDASAFERSNAAKFLAELVEIEEARRRPADAGGLEHSRKKLPPLDRATMERLRQEAHQKAIEVAAAQCVAQLAAAWGERLRAWSAVEDVFGELGAMCGLGWDLSRSVLRHTGWQDAERLADLLKKLDQVREIVRTLGRMRSAEADRTESVLERLLGSVRRTPEERRDVETPGTPHDTRGVERSGEIARMLPSEAILFNRPRLRFLWHARRAERTLMTYRVIGTEAVRFIPDDQGRDAREVERHRKKQERGPIIVCLDTSGSMQGAPETVAKAVTLEAMRLAHAEKRECYLYAFSGPQDVAEFDLSIAKGGIAALLEFLGASFHGGTDVAEPVARAIKRLETGSWLRADVVVVSDGEFPVPDHSCAAIAAAKKERQLRVHGLLIGAAESRAMSALCEPLHVFKDWNALKSGCCS